MKKRKRKEEKEGEFMRRSTEDREERVTRVCDPRVQCPIMQCPTKCVRRCQTKRREEGGRRREKDAK